MDQPSAPKKQSKSRFGGWGLCDGSVERSLKRSEPPADHFRCADWRRPIASDRTMLQRLNATFTQCLGENVRMASQGPSLRLLPACSQRCRSSHAWQFRAQIKVLKQPKVAKWSQRQRHFGRVALGAICCSLTV